MWSKLSSALKRQGGEDSEQADVMSSVLEKHPNLSVFHNEDDKEPDEVPFPIPSPPSSPSKNGRRGMFKRMSRGPKFDLSEASVVPGPLKMHLPKKVKSHLNLSINESQASLNSLPDPATSMRRSSDTNRPSTDSAHPPMTPIEGRFGSLRSILRDRNTPATGQSVRFFSRDAYKVISPDASAASELDDPCFIERLQQAEGSPNSTRPRPRLTQDMFSPSKTSTSSLPPSPAYPSHSMMSPLPLPDISNIFDLSQRDLPTIPMDTGVTLLDNAVEAFEGDESKDSIQASLGSVALPPTPPSKDNETVFHSMERTPAHDRSQSFSFGQTVFQAMPKRTSAEKAPLSASALAEGYPGRPPSRNRSMSDTMFHSILRSRSPEADINDISSSSLVLYAEPSAEKRDRPEPDPFSANATTYYTPGTMMPPTPPPPTHARKASREEDLIWSLQTQLTLQQELCAQYEVDLGARDELVSTLKERVDSLEKEGEKRRTVVRGWKKKVQELERMCRHLEEEVDQSRQESFERSVMDEASGEALRQLHRQISDLERQKSDTAKRAEEEKAVTAEEVEQLKADLKKREEGEKALKEGIRDAQEQIEQMGAGMGMEGEEGLRAVVVQREQANEEERERHRLAEFEWAEERATLVTAVDASAKAKADMQGAVDRAEQALAQKDEELRMLQAELEAQWKNTEETGERMQELKREKDTLQGELVGLEAKVESMELEWNEGENRRMEVESELQELYEAKEILEGEKAQSEGELRAEREHAEEVTRALQEREDRVEALQQELKYAVDNASRLEQNVRQRDGDIEDLAHRIIAREDEAEELHGELSNLKREQTHNADEQQRALVEITARSQDAQTQLEAAIREKAESDVEANSLRERVRVLEEEIGRLRRQVHELKTESADKEVRLLQMEKQRNAAREDFDGANIALDSKQQELELIKRKLSVKGTAGATPVANKTAHHRRESSVFSTPAPGGSRPASRLSDAGRDATKSSKETPVGSSAARFTALGKSVRANGSVVSTPSVVAKPAVRPARSVDGAMGPPPSSMKPRPSVAGTPTPTHSRIPSSSLARSAMKPTVPSTPTLGPRRTSSAMATELTRLTKPSVAPVRDVETASESERSEKENTEPESRRRTPVAA